MATIQIVVPGDGTAEQQEQRWIAEVSSHLDAGNDVQFMDPEGNNAVIKYIMLNTGGVLYLCPDKTATDTNRTSLSRVLSFLAGGWHRQTIHWIYAAASDTGLEAHVRV